MLVSNLPFIIDCYRGLREYNYNLEFTNSNCNVKKTYMHLSPIQYCLAMIQHIHVTTYISPKKVEFHYLVMACTSFVMIQYNRLTIFLAPKRNRNVVTSLQAITWHYKVVKF